MRYHPFPPTTSHLSNSISSITTLRTRAAIQAVVVMTHILLGSAVISLLASVAFSSVECDSSRMQKSGNNSQHESTPRQRAIHLPGDTHVDPLALRARRTTAMSLRARQDRYSDESADKEDVEDNQQHADDVGVRFPDDKLQERGDDSVEDCGREDSFYDPVGSGCTTGKADYFCDAHGEED